MLVLLSLALLASGACAAPKPTSEIEVKKWLRNLLPLPKQIKIERQITVPLDCIRLSLSGFGGELEEAAADELTELLGDDIRERTHPENEFSITFGLLGGPAAMTPPYAGVELLDGAPNRDQGYVIYPAANSGLSVCAYDARGLYYGCKTLQQLLRPGLTEGQLTIPLAEVVDWPDLAERGEWGGSANDDIEWMAERKMNLVESHVRMSLDEDGHGVAKLDETLLERGRKHALKVVPIITHLDQLGHTGIYERYPELKGVGESAKGTWSADQVAPCFSQPKMSEILAEWFASLASQEGVSDICVWLSEAPLQCGCAACKQEGQFVLEAKAAVRAWELARTKFPQIRLRILLTQGSYSTNDKVLAVVPPEVGVTYYDGARTYDSSREPMIYPLLENYAKQGRWLGCYPQLTASWRIVCPWSGPQFIKYRMTEFVQDRLQCLCGYATPHNRLYDFNVQAAAEWSWNSAGRDEWEFAAAWATREGLRNPEQVADWAVMLGPVGWDVYGSRIPYSAFFGTAAKLVADRKLPTLGEGMFRYFPTVEHFDDDLATCNRALVLARELQAPTLIAETETIGGYVRMLKAIYEIAVMVAGKQGLEDAERLKLQALMDDLDAASRATVAALERWEDACGDGLGGSRFRDTVAVTENTSRDIAKALAQFGITDPSAPYRPQKIGTWESTDFQPGAESITKRWTVTEAVSGPGTYRVRFDYTRGWWGLTIDRVALLAAPRDAEPTEVVADQHHGVAAYKNEANTYTLPLKEYSPDLVYTVVAEIKGVTSEGKPEGRRGCEGEVWMWLERPTE
ncbi:MAG: glycoside hydrolase family 20 zincin-like fold domain-containing protein [Candidatus Zipacnadales bacterium]